MDKTVTEYMKKYPHLKRLHDDHQKCEKKLAKLNTIKQLQPKDEVERKKLQKMKLQKKDEIEKLISELKQRKSVA